MKENLAFQNKGPIENFLAYMYNRPYLYVVLLIGIVIFVACRQKDLSVLISMAITIVTIILAFILFSYVWPF